MSHFVCLVITDERPNQDILSKALQPYHEYECTGVKDEYVKWIDHTAEVTAEWEAGEWVMQIYNDTPEPVAHAIEKDKYPTLEDYATKFHGYELENDQFGRWTNPNKRWDWWQVGGRWTGMLRVKQPVANEHMPMQGQPGLMTAAAATNEFDSCRFADLDLEGMLEAAKARRHALWLKAELAYEENRVLQPRLHGVSFADASQRWVKVLERLKPMAEAEKKKMRELISDDEEASVLRSAITAPMFLGGIEPGETLETFRDQARALHAHAVLMDNQWFEHGEMGYWAMVIDEKPDWDKTFEKLLSQVKPDQWLTVCDCHI